MWCTGIITDVVSYYTLPSSVIGNDKYDSLKAAFMYYTVATETPLQDLMQDILIFARDRQVCTKFDMAPLKIQNHSHLNAQLTVVTLSCLSLCFWCCTNIRLMAICCTLLDMYLGLD